MVTLSIQTQIKHKIRSQKKKSYVAPPATLVPRGQGRALSAAAPGGGGEILSGTNDQNINTTRGQGSKRAVEQRKESNREIEK